MDSFDWFGYALSELSKRNVHCTQGGPAFALDTLHIRWHRSEATAISLGSDWASRIASQFCSGGRSECTELLGL